MYFGHAQDESAHFSHVWRHVFPRHSPDNVECRNWSKHQIIIICLTRKHFIWSYNVWLFFEGVRMKPHNKVIWKDTWRRTTLWRDINVLNVNILPTHWDISKSIIQGRYGMSRDLKGYWYTSSVSSCKNIYFLPSEKGSGVQGKNLLPKDANSFFVEWTPFESTFFPFRMDPFSDGVPVKGRNMGTKTP